MDENVDTVNCSSEWIPLVIFVDPHVILYAFLFLLALSFCFSWGTKVHHGHNLILRRADLASSGRRRSLHAAGARSPGVDPRWDSAGRSSPQWKSSSPGRCRGTQRGSARLASGTGPRWSSISPEPATLQLARPAALSSIQLARSKTQARREACTSR